MTTSNEWGGGSSSAGPSDPLSEPIGSSIDDRSDAPPLDPGDEMFAGERAGASTGDGGAKEKAQQTAGAASDEGSRVASVTKDEATQVAGEAKEKAASLLDEARQQVEEQSRTQMQSLATRLDELGSELESMASASDQPGVMTELAEQLASRARALSSRLDGGEPQQLLDEVRSFARQRPGTFLLGAAAAGIVAGRLARGARESDSTGQAGSTGSGSSTTPATTASGTTGTSAGTTDGGAAWTAGGQPVENPAGTGVIR